MINNPIDVFPLLLYMWTLSREAGRLLLAAEITFDNLKAIKKFIQESHEKNITQRRYKVSHQNGWCMILKDDTGLEIPLYIGDFLILDADEATKGLADADLIFTKLEGNLAKTRLRPVNLIKTPE